MANVEKGHVWSAPSWQQLPSRMQHWSVRPCARPVFAAHMTAGHNALRGSGLEQLRAFDNASGLVGDKANTGGVDCAVGGHVDLAKFIRKEI